MHKTRPILPVILAGGQGMRLWPASLPNIPKQFIKMGAHSLMFQSLERALAISDQDILVLTGEQYLPLFSEILAPELLQAANNTTLQDRKIILIGEPEAKNTAPALALATRYALDFYPDAILMVITADHIISPLETLVKDIKTAVKIASSNETDTYDNKTEDDKIVTFGIRPSYPETGYGYIELGQALDNNSGINSSRPAQRAGAYQVLSFKEKPNSELAQKYLDQGNYLWNSGMFCFPARLMYQEMQKFCPELHRLILNPKSSFTWQLDQSGIFSTRLPRGIDFGSIEKISIDYAVMEHSKQVASIEANFDWNDIGSWDEAIDILSTTNKDNKTYLEDAQNITVYSDIPVGISGISDLIVIIKNQRALILKKGRGQKVTNIAKKDKENN